MKKYAVFGFCLLLTSALFAPYVSAAIYPNLIGTWSGTGKGVSPDMGFFDISVTMIVVEQQGKLFRGTMEATSPGGTPSTIPFSGIIILPDKEIVITLGYDSIEHKPLYTSIRGKLAGRTYSAYWQNVEAGDCGAITLKKS